MSNVELYPDQRAALEKLYSGAILCGGTGSGKTYTSLFFYKEKYFDRPLYVITTAKKRDSGDWQEEARSIGINDIFVDSWNMIEKYKEIKDAFFIFDEQRVVGYGKWSRTFIQIAKKNKWILATATPADVWMDYIPVFIANGFYKNKTHFIDQHVEFNPYVKFPQVKKYHNVEKLEYLEKKILIQMKTKKHTNPIRKYVRVEHDKDLYLSVLRKRWNPFKDRPIKNVSEFFHVLRRSASDSEQRRWYLEYLIDIHDRVIVFYNFDYELEILREVCEASGKRYSEWNGHKHEPIPESNEWVYLTQYSSGGEAWNCIETNVMIFYSPNYSYRMTTQAEGRIDRRNTPYVDLEYFYLMSPGTIEDDILKTNRQKKNFNERAWTKRKGLTW